MPVQNSADQRSLSEIQAEYGGSNPISMTEYYSGGPYMPAGSYTFSNYGTPLSGSSSGSPTSGTISMKDISLIPGLSWAKGAGPLQTVNSNSNTSAWKELADCGVDPASITTGRTIYLCMSMNAGWNRYPHMTSTITVGTASNFRTPHNGDKTYNMQMQYDGGSKIRLYGWYSGPGTGNPNGQVFLTGIGVV